MNPGKRDKRISIYSVSTTKSSSGSLSPSRTLIAEVWSNVRELHGFLKSDSGRESAVQKVMFTIDYRNDLKSEYIIVYGSKDWEIETTKELGNFEDLEIKASLKE